MIGNPTQPNFYFLEDDVIATNRKKRYKGGKINFANF